MDMEHDDMTKTIGNDVYNSLGDRLGRISGPVFSLREQVGNGSWSSDPDVKICAHAIMEHGGRFKWVWLCDTSTGDIYSIPVEEVRKLKCDKDDNHLARWPDDFKLLDREGVERQLSDI